MPRHLLARKRSFPAVLAAGCFYITSVGRTQIFQRSLGSKHTRLQARLESGWAAVAKPNAASLPPPATLTQADPPHARERQGAARLKMPWALPGCPQAPRPHVGPHRHLATCQPVALRGQGWGASPTYQGASDGCYVDMRVSQEWEGVSPRIVEVQILRAEQWGREGPQ